MNNIIETNNLTYTISNNTILNNINLKIKEGSFITIVGPSGSGKSTLLKALSGIIKTSGTITIDKKNISEIKDIRKIISIIFENPNYYFSRETVKDNLVFPLENLNYKKEDIDKNLNEICNELKISHLLNYKVNNLSGGEKQLISLAIALIKKPKILLLDEAFMMIDTLQKDKILKYLKKINNKFKITIINITHDIEESLYSKEIIIMNNGNIVAFDKNKNVYKNEKIFKDNKIDLPFMVDLSNKLKYYGLVDEIILDMDKMVDYIWK